MFKRYTSQHPLVMWFLILFLASLVLAACSGTSLPAIEAPPAPAEKEADVDESGEETEEVAAAPEEAMTSEPSDAAETAPNENLLAPPSVATCQTVDIPDNNLIAAISDKDWSKGPTDAPITIIEYGDFQWPGCAAIFPVVESLKADYGDDLRVIYRHLPLLSIHDKAQITAEAVEAAGVQGKFWEMHDILFEHQPDWSSLPEAGMIEILVGYAEEVGLDDIAQFEADLENDTYAEKVVADYEAAIAANLSSTPSFVINQVDYPAQAFGLSYEGLDTFIKLMQLRERWYEQPEQVIDLEKEYIATIETAQGNIVVELFADTAPVNVNSFAFLAQQGWYEDITFHRVLPGFVAQGGDPTGTGVGFPGYRCSDEIVPSRAFDGPGVVSLANSGANTNGGQFFITYDAVPQLNDGFTIIGQVIEGQDIAENLTPRDPQNDPQVAPGDKIINITIEEKS